MMIFYVILCVGIGILFVALGIPLARGKVKPNAMYGLRVGETMADERVWYEANRVSGRELVRFGALLILLAVLLAYPLRSHPDAYITTQVVAILVGTLVYAGRSMESARRIARELDGPSPEDS